MASDDWVAPEFRSGVPDMAWPAIPRPRACQTLSWLFQLDHSQWLPPAQIQANQRRQLTLLLRHALATSPFHKPRLRAAGWGANRDLTEDLWRQIPIMTRTDWQLAGADLYSTAPPAGHGQVSENITSGSTGTPVRILTTALALELGQAFTLRDLFWRRRDWRGKLASIRYTTAPDCAYPQGKLFPNWGIGAALVTGPAALLSIATPLAQQAEWLVRYNPDYLMTYPSNLMALCRYFQDHALVLPKLREVRTFGELLEPAVRPTCRRVWNVPVTDLYSSNEVNNIALQCPAGENYHVQEENVRVEVLDAADRPCQPGEIGRVVITALANFATPIIRYAIGDYAEVGEPCSCGRGLMVLKRILGRARNMFTLPDGRQVWPSISPTLEGSGLSEYPPIQQLQVVQRNLREIEMLLVMPRTMSPLEENLVRRWLEHGIGPGFDVRFTYVERISAGPSGKFEDFRSEVSPPPTL